MGGEHYLQQKRRQTFFGCIMNAGIAAAVHPVPLQQLDEDAASKESWERIWDRNHPCATPDDKSCKPFHRLKDYYCQHAWTKHHCKHMCDLCDTDNGSGG